MIPKANILPKKTRELYSLLTSSFNTKEKAKNIISTFNTILTALRQSSSFEARRYKTALIRQIDKAKEYFLKYPELQKAVLSLESYLKHLQKTSSVENRITAFSPTTPKIQRPKKGNPKTIQYLINAISCLHSSLKQSSNPKKVVNKIRNTSLWLEKSPLSVVTTYRVTILRLVNWAGRLFPISSSSVLSAIAALQNSHYNMKFFFTNKEVFSTTPFRLGKPSTSSYLYEYKTTSLHNAVHSNNLQKVKNLLTRGANPQLLDQNGRSPLYWAETVQIATLLLRHGADPCTCMQNWMFLYRAFEKRKTLIPLYLKYAENSDAGKKTMASMLTSAIERTILSLVKLLCKYNVGITNQHIQSAKDLTQQLDEKIWGTSTKKKATQILKLLNEKKAKDTFSQMPSLLVVNLPDSSLYDD